MNIRERIAENGVTLAGAGITIASPELLIGFAGLLITLGGFLWSICRDKQAAKDRAQADAEALEEIKRHNKEVERLTALEVEAKIAEMKRGH